jgi:hypothetical protein
MKRKDAKKIVGAIDECEECTKAPKVSDLTEDWDLFISARRRSIKSKPYAAMSQLWPRNFGVMVLPTERICQTHRDLIIRKSRVLFEVVFHPQGTKDEIVPKYGKNHTWWTLYWKDPAVLEDDEVEAWALQARHLGRMIQGFDKLPRRRPPRMRTMTPHENRDTFDYRLERDGYVRVYSEMMGDTILVLRDDDVEIPKQYKTLPDFTMDELVKIAQVAHADPEFLPAIMMMKKHLGAEVVQ